ncbi:hypothetical protein GCM10022243_64360 [Saccharothrix violaceirubra]|uniref:Tail protein n=1 Tax=Saccharothrix violaceirubra TaxID=413306 RepID=A0A7W7WZ37_9PSEU|nr:hypothetical protein [Saccharothrix violaceirubra]MBB4969080.1 hypothetical protein [Saccharothrix violaceirubra]
MATYTVDGVPLDHPAGCWKLLAATQVRPLPGARAASVVIPGRPGELPLVGADVEATTIGLTLGITGASPTGIDQGAAGLDANLAALYGLFGVRHRMLELRYRPAPTVAEVAAEATVTAASEPQMWVGAARARLAVIARIPGAFWRDVAARVWSTPEPGFPERVTTLDGSTAPVSDTVWRITGPISDLRIADSLTDSWVSYPGTLDAGRQLRIHCGRLDAHEAASIAWDGTSAGATGRITNGGPGSARGWLTFTPVPVTSAHDRGVQVLIGGTGTSSATLIEMRARRAFL